MRPHELEHVAPRRALERGDDTVVHGTRIRENWAGLLWRRGKVELGARGVEPLARNRRGPRQPPGGPVFDEGVRGSEIDPPPNVEGERPAHESPRFVDGDANRSVVQTNEVRRVFVTILCRDANVRLENRARIHVDQVHGLEGAADHVPAERVLDGRGPVGVYANPNVVADLMRLLPGARSRGGQQHEEGCGKREALA
jgi:hypothetical protein